MTASLIELSRSLFDDPHRLNKKYVLVGTERDLQSVREYLDDHRQQLMNQVQLVYITDSTYTLPMVFIDGELEGHSVEIFYRHVSWEGEKRAAVETKEQLFLEQLSFEHVMNYLYHKGDIDMSVLNDLNSDKYFIVILGKSYCPYYQQTHKLVNRWKQHCPSKKCLAYFIEIQRSSDVWPTYQGTTPVVFVGQKHLGGASELESWTQQTLKKKKRSS